MPLVVSLTRRRCRLYLAQSPKILWKSRSPPQQSGINCFTKAAELSLQCIRSARGQARYKAGQFRQVRDPEQRAASPHDDLRIGSDDIGPLRRNGADYAVVEAQQQAPTSPVVALADTDGWPADERMKGVGYENTLHACDGNACILE